MEASPNNTMSFVKNVGKLWTTSDETNQLPPLKRDYLFDAKRQPLNV